MNLIYYADDAERKRALLSCARECGTSGATLLYFGSGGSCEIARHALRDAKTQPRVQLRFKSLPLGERDALAGPTPAQVHAAIDLVRCSLLEGAAVEGRVAVWLDLPLPSQGKVSVETFALLCESLKILEQSSAEALLISCRLSAVPDDALRCLFQAGYTMSPAAAAPSGVELTPQPATETAPPDYPSPAVNQLGPIIAGIAHELGNPLSVVSSSLQYLDQHPTLAADEGLREFSHAGLQNVDRIQGVIKNMRDRATAPPPERVEVDLNVLLSELLQAAAPECRRRSIEVEVAFEPALPVLMLDQVGIREACAQLLDNAIDALGEDGRRLSIRTWIEPELAMVAVEVADDGPGIPEEVRDNMFRPFYSTKEGHPGLGLHLARRCAMEHRGNLFVADQPSGARFTLKLPLPSDERSGHGARPHHR